MNYRRQLRKLGSTYQKRASGTDWKKLAVIPLRLRKDYRERIG